MPSAVAGIVGGSVVSGIFGSRAASEQASATRAAGKAGLEGTRLSVEESRRQFDIMREDTRPYRDMGEAALYELGSIFGLPSPVFADLDAKRAELASLEQQIAALPTTTTDRSDARLRDIERYLRSSIRSQYDDSAGGAPGLRYLTSLASKRARGAPTQGTAARSNLAARIASLKGEIAGLESRAAALPPPGQPSYDVTKSPGYQFRLAEGEKALQRAQTAGGRRLSGRAVKEGQRYAQDYASGEYGNYLDRLYRLAGFGSSAVGTSAAAGTQTAANVGAAYGRGYGTQANALLAGGQAAANRWGALNQAVQGGLSNYFLYDYLRNPGAGGATGAYGYA